MDKVYAVLRSLIFSSVKEITVSVRGTAAYEYSQVITSPSIISHWHLFDADVRIVHVTITITIRYVTLRLGVVINQTDVSLGKISLKTKTY